MITICSTNNATIRVITDHASGQPVGEIEVIRPKWIERPARADFVITRARLSVAVERWAASLGAQVIQIPESVPYLIEQACKRSIVVVGSDYKQYSDRIG